MFGNKTKHITLIVILCCVLLLAALVLTQVTAAFYVTKKTLPDELDFNIEHPVEILTADDFRDAIDKGHSVIKVSDRADDPLYLTGEELELSVSLLIDLNGHDLKRNGRDPVLSIPSGKTLVIYDSVEDPDAVGSFYNPVGSVLEINGGNITIVNGKYESGVRANEYYGEYAAGDVSGYISNAYFYTRSGDPASPVYIGNNVNTVPVIEMTDARSAGDLYMPRGQSFASSNAVDTFNPLSAGGDYYLYYVPRSNAVRFRQPRNADFFYIYKKVGEAFISLPQADSDHSYNDEMYNDSVFIYGFYQNKATADLDTTHYGAVVMNSGSLAIGGGDFVSYYGNDTSHCVYATGGELVINGGKFSTQDMSGCIDCEITGSGSVTIKGGRFYSERGNLIEVSQGAVSISGGTFEKDVSESSPATGVTDTYNNALISVKRGTLTVGGDELINFNVKGSYVRGIECIGADSVATLKNIKMDFIEPGADDGVASYQNNTGVYNDGGIVTVGGSLINIPSNNSIGIKSVYCSGGENTVNIDPNGAGYSVFVMSGEHASIVDSEGGNISIGCVQNTAPQNNTLFYLDHVHDCYGVKIGSANETVTAKTVVDLNSVQFFMGHTYFETEAAPPRYYQTANRNDTIFNSCGISINSTDSGSAVNVVSAKMFCAGSYTAGIFARNGKVNQTGANKKFAIFSGGKFKGYIGKGLYSSSAGSHFVTRFGNNYCVSKYAESYYDTNAEFDVEHTNAIAGYGVVSLGGKVALNDLYVGGYATYGAGVYAGGLEEPANDSDFILTINTLRSNISIESNTNKTIYASASARPLKFEDVYGVGENDITSSAIKVTGGIAIVRNSNINTDANAIVLQASGVTSALEFGQPGNTSHTNIINSTRAGAIRMEGGSLMVCSGDTLTVDKCTISTDTSLTNEKGAALTPNAVTVSGGNFTCYGNFNINSFTGLSSDNSHLINGATGRYLNFGNEVIKSFAVAVTGGKFEVKPYEVQAGETPVLPNLTVKTQVGGGISVEGGSVTLGTADVAGGQTSKIKIYTFGNDFVKDDHRYSPSNSTDRANISVYYSPVYNYKFSATSQWTGEHSWRGVQNLTGGHALQVLGGNCIVYNGDLSAALGNAVYVKNSSGSNVVEIHGGSYYGYNGAELYTSGENEGSKNTAGINGTTYNEWFPYMMNKAQGGPASYYGLKVLGSATVKIYGGEFDGGNGGAYVTGYYSNYDPSTSSFSRNKKLTANIYVYEGEFRNSMSTDGFNIADNAKLIMGAYTQAQISARGFTKEYLRKAIRIEAPATCIALNSVHNNEDAGELGNGPVDLSVYYGSYLGTNATPNFIGSYHTNYTIRCAFNNSSFEEGTSKIIPTDSYLLCENFIQSGSANTVYKNLHPGATNNKFGKVAGGPLGDMNIVYDESAAITASKHHEQKYGGINYVFDFYASIGNTSPSFYTE